MHSQLYLLPRILRGGGCTLKGVSFEHGATTRYISCSDFEIAFLFTKENKWQYALIALTESFYIQSVDTHTHTYI